MSSVLRVDLRERWAARSIVVRRWLCGETFEPRSSICELDIDGELLTFEENKLVPPDNGSVYWRFVEEGREVGPWGLLLEYSDSGGRVRRSGQQVRATRMQMRFRRRDRYPRIFLNYRRDDSEAIAGRVHERLSTVFGEDDVFMDQFSLRPGEFYAWTLQQALAHAEAVVSLIGPKWSALMTKDTPLASERDFVRRELVAALDRGTTLFPVLVSGAGIPDVSRDHELSEMLDLQFHGLSTRHWSFDVDALVGAIRERLESARA